MPDKPSVGLVWVARGEGGGGYMHHVSETKKEAKRVTQKQQAGGEYSVGRGGKEGAG